jgi:hypothetical protein
MVFSNQQCDANTLMADDLPALRARGVTAPPPLEDAVGIGVAGRFGVGSRRPARRGVRHSGGGLAGEEGAELADGAHQCGGEDDSARPISATTMTRTPTVNRMDISRPHEGDH